MLLAMVELMLSLKRPGGSRLALPLSRIVASSTGFAIPYSSLPLVWTLMLTCLSTCDGTQPVMGRTGRWNP